MNNNSKVIVLGMSPTGKYVGKEAYESGIKCIAFDFKKGAAYYSKYFEKKELVTEDQLLEKFRDELFNNGITYYVCPTSDEWIAFISKNNELFKGTNLITSTSYLDGKFNLLADKFELLKLSENNNLNYPKSVIYTPGKGEKPNLSNLEFPLFIKPTNRAGLAHIMKGKKGWLLNNVSEWESFDQLAELNNIELLIQEVIIGNEANIKVLGTIANNKTYTKSWVGIKYRQYPHGFGSGSLIGETQDNELDNITKILIDKTDYSGFFALETKYCEKRKKTFVIEVNTRPGLWFGATTTANCGFVIEWINNFGINEYDLNSIRSSRTQDKVVWRYLYKDFFIGLTKNNRFSIRKNIGGTIKMSYAVYDRKDIKPFVFDFFNGIKKVMGF